MSLYSICYFIGLYSIAAELLSSNNLVLVMVMREPLRE